MSTQSMVRKTKPTPTYLKPIASFLTHGLLMPFLWLIDKAGLSVCIWRKVVKIMGKHLTGGHGFGNYQPSSRDVIICAFPKCGINWVMQIAFQIAARGEGEYEHIHDVIPWPEMADDYAISLSDLVQCNNPAPNKIIIKTHLERTGIPYSDKAKYIYIIRDPKDVFVSNYFFFRDIAFGPIMPSVATWLDVFRSDDFPYAWANHLDSFWQYRHQPNVLIMSYEKMLCDLAESVKKIAAFLEIQLTESEFNLVCEKSSFGYMKRINHKFVPPVYSPWTSPDRQMIRRGESGNSSELLNPEQQNAIDAWCKEELQRLNCHFPYDRIWGAKRSEMDPVHKFKGDSMNRPYC